MNAANDIRETREKQGMEESVHYILKDHLGSWTTITDADGNVEQELSYDAWGRRRNPNGFGYGNVSHTFDRGYTLHEHYDHFDLINMNGRLYDPVIGRMFSPDIVIQDEHNLQAYNRYSYCFNNPLRFTDPSGYVVQMPFEYYGLETFGYGYLGRHSFKGSSFNTEATEGRQIPLDDWFENEETGEVYYNANMHKGDEGSGDMKGNGWKWLGPNGMFTDGDIGAEISLVARRNGIINNDEVSLMLDPIAANRFMLAQGYKQVPKQAIEYSYSYTESYIATPGRNFNITYGENYRYWEKVRYVPKDFVLMATTTIGQTLYGTQHRYPFYMPQVSRHIYSYEKPKLLGRIGKALKTLNGYHDYINVHNCGSIQNAQLRGEQGELIRRFLLLPNY